MDEKKQIEEMAKLICTYPQCIHHNIIGECANTECQIVDIAENLYKQGYHKQREGEWKEVYRNNQATVYECTNCNHLSFGISDYCICGAKMKSGAE